MEKWSLPETHHGRFGNAVQRPCALTASGEPLGIGTIAQTDHEFGYRPPAKLAGRIARCSGSRRAARLRTDRPVASAGPLSAASKNRRRALRPPGSSQWPATVYRTFVDRVQPHATEANGRNLQSATTEPTPVHHIPLQPGNTTKPVDLAPTVPAHRWPQAAPRSQRTPRANPSPRRSGRQSQARSPAR